MHNRSLLLTFSALLPVIATFMGCSEGEIIPPDRDELYTREFVKEFGSNPEGLPFSEAQSSVITIVTDTPTPVTVLAEVDGEKYMFASIGSVIGTQPVMVNVPRCVKELIVLADGREYVTPIGSVLNLASGGGRSISTSTGSDNGLTISYDNEAHREITFSGRALKEKYCDKFNPVDGCPYFQDPSSTALFYYNSYHTSKNDKWFNVYPIYWRKDRHGDKDYIIGAYGFDVTKPAEICCIDLDIPVSTAIMYKKTGDDDWVVSDGDEAYDYGSVGNDWTFKVEGAHIELDGFEGNSQLVGFYIKTGLKDTYTDGFGRDCEHISFTQPRFNAKYWTHGFWNLRLKDINYCYAAAAGKVGTVFNYSWCTPVHLDAYGDKSNYRGFSLGFMTEPDDIFTNDPDFSDCVLLLEGPSGNRREVVQYGEDFKCFPWYIAAEDLGGSYDWDFNDLVVTVYDITTDYTRKYTQANGNYPVPSILGRRIIVEPRAAGGTMPIYLMYEGQVGKSVVEDTYVAEIIDSKFSQHGTYIVGTELHRWLRAEGHERPINVKSDVLTHSGRALSFSIPLDALDAIDPMRPPTDLGADNTPLHGFWVLVDPEDEMKYYNSVSFNPSGVEEDYENGLTPFSGRLGDGTYAIHAPNENNSHVAPQMLLCYYGWFWPREEVNIGEAWPWFRDWVAGTRDIWHPANNTTENPPYIPGKVCKVEMPTHRE